MKAFLSLVCLLVIMSDCECDIIVRQRQINGRIKTYYKLTGMTYDFKSTLGWCHGLGGQLPIILTRDELDFLADDVVVKDDLAGTGIFVTWMGLKKDRGFCSNWLDGTEVNMTFSYNPKCESCTASCCAMIMWNDSKDYAKMGFKDCREGAKAVCVFDEEKAVVLPKDPAYLTKLYGQLNDSILVLSEKTQKKIQSITEEHHETRRQVNQNEKQVKNIQTWVDDNVNIKSDTMKKIDSLAQKTENNLDKVKLDVSELQSLAMKEHIETKKILDETRHKLSETENKLKKLQTWIDDHIDIKEIDGLKKSSSTSNILHWTSLGMIGCLAVILAVVGYRTRRNSLPVTPEPSVTYVAEEEILNFSSAGSSSLLSNANFRINNLSQAEQDYRGAP